MPAVCLTDIKDIADIIKHKYSKSLKDMTFVFCYRREDGRYLIFQELHSVPIQRFVYHESNDSISFSAGWSAWANPHALVKDVNTDEVSVWMDLCDRSRLYNTTINEQGSFNTNEWTLGNRKNTTEKKRKLKTKFDTIMEFRTDRIERVAFYNWGFEVYSASLSFIALLNHHTFPYTIEGNVPNEYSYDNDDDDDDGEALPLTHTIRYNGKSFDINNRVIVHQHVISLGSSGSSPNEPVSYWDKNECDPENDEFDEELIRMFLYEEVEMEDLLDVGQREVNLML